MIGFAKPAVQFVHWQEIIAIGGAIVVGAVSSLFFSWSFDSGSRTDLTILEIFFHNGLLALIAILFTTYVALPLVVFNGFVLGMVLIAHVIHRGWLATFQLTVPHIPLEIFAWVLTLRAAEMMKRNFKVVVKTKKFLNLRLMLWWSGAAFACYLIAAIFEYLEWNLFARG